MHTLPLHTPHHFPEQGSLQHSHLSLPFSITGCFTWHLHNFIWSAIITSYPNTHILPLLHYTVLKRSINILQTGWAAMFFKYPANPFAVKTSINLVRVMPKRSYIYSERVLMIDPNRNWSQDLITLCATVPKPNSLQNALVILFKPLICFIPTILNITWTAISSNYFNVSYIQEF